MRTSTARSPTARQQRFGDVQPVTFGLSVLYVLHDEQDPPPGARLEVLVEEGQAQRGVGRVLTLQKISAPACEMPRLGEHLGQALERSRQSPGEPPCRSSRVSFQGARNPHRAAVARHGAGGVVIAQTHHLHPAPRVQGAGDALDQSAQAEPTLR